MRRVAQRFSHPFLAAHPLQLPGVTWPDAPFRFSSEEIYKTPKESAYKLHVCAILSGEIDVLRVEEALKNLTCGNTSAVSSCSFQAFQKA